MYSKRLEERTFTANDNVKFTSDLTFGGRKLHKAILVAGKENRKN